MPRRKRLAAFSFKRCIDPARMYPPGVAVYIALCIMSYCPNCEQVVAATAPECKKCGALFGNGGWLPSSEPIVFAKSPTLLMVGGNLLVWLGHFFLVGFPVLFFVFHILFYRGGGTSGVPLGLSVIVSPLFYLPGFIVRALARRRDA